MEIKVRINGTDKNPWNKFNLKQNPFPQIGLAEFDAGERQLNSLDGDPIKSADDIRARLAGFDEKFIEGVIERWTPGKRVEFTLTFPEER